MKEPLPYPFSSSPKKKPPLGSGSSSPSHSRKRVFQASFTLEPQDNKRLASLCGRFDEHLRQIENQMGVDIHNRGHEFHIEGSDATQVETTACLLRTLYEETGLRKGTRPSPLASSEYLSPHEIHLRLKQHQASSQKRVETRSQVMQQETAAVGLPLQVMKTRLGRLEARTPNQALYLENISENNVNFAIGPAGTGKTFLAVACAIAALEQEKVRRILLVRPAVEAGERLGFLPGDLAQKIDPYLKPLYDALYEMLGFDKVSRLLEKHTIEIAPLAYMRGRTLNDAFIILDESQNTTPEQMKMFLTRLGFNSTAVITGDITQVDLPKGKISGLKHILKILPGVPGISFTFFDSTDVIRHPVVQKIIDAYDAYEQDKELGASQ